MHSLIDGGSDQSNAFRPQTINYNLIAYCLLKIAQNQLHSRMLGFVFRYLSWNSVNDHICMLLTTSFVFGNEKKIFFVLDFKELKIFAISKQIPIS